jgi:hypothetical protein
MPVIDDTVCGSTTNSFCSLEEYKVYILDRMPTLLPAKVTYDQLVTMFVDGDLDSQLSRSLIRGASLLCQSIVWNGAIPVEDQALCFGRSGLVDREGRVVDSISHPVEIKLAQMEWSWLIYNGVGVDLSSRDIVGELGVSRVKAGSVELGFHDRKREPIDVAYLKLDPRLSYLNVPGSVLNYIPANWYQRDNPSLTTSKRLANVRFV